MVLINTDGYHDIIDVSDNSILALKIHYFSYGHSMYGISGLSILNGQFFDSGICLNKPNIIRKFED